jgi:hypothetical protein
MRESLPPGQSQDAISPTVGLPAANECVFNRRKSRGGPADGASFSVDPMNVVAPHSYMFRTLGEVGRGGAGIVEKV